MHMVPMDTKGFKSFQESRVEWNESQRFKKREVATKLSSVESVYIRAFKNVL